MGFSAGAGMSSRSLGTVRRALSTTHSPLKASLRTSVRLLHALPTRPTVGIVGDQRSPRAVPVPVSQKRHATYVRHNPHPKPVQGILRPTAPASWARIYDPRVSNGISPKSVLIVNKLRTKPVVDAIDVLLKYIREKYPDVEIYHEDRPDIPECAKVWHPGPDAKPIDLVITLGGDGTILHASSLFKTGAVPPVLSFSMGTLGFLLPFHIDDYTKAIDSAFAGRITVLHRMRLSCTFQDSGGERIDTQCEDWQVMNEVALHRGSSPHLNTIDVFVDGQHLTEAVSDGLIVSTPTGSTAYSLSAGGPIVHPSLSAIVLTPICPRSLSFRPLVFPSSSSITLRISERSRASAGLSMDGQVSHILSPGEAVTVRASLYPIPCINRSSITEPEDILEGEGAGPGKEDDWVRDINNLLQYNATFRSKALTRHSRS